MWEGFFAYRPSTQWNATAGENSSQHIELLYLKSLCLLSSLPEDLVQLLWPHTNITRKWAYVSIIQTNGDGRMWINAPASSLSFGVLPRYRYIPQCLWGFLQDRSPFAHIYQSNPSLETHSWLSFLFTVSHDHHFITCASWGHLLKKSSSPKSPSQNLYQ